MTVLYCILVEFYDSGVVKVGMTAKQMRKIPVSQCKKYPGMTAYKIWLYSFEVANDLYDGIRNKDIEQDQVSYFLTDMLSNQGKVA